MDGGRDTMADPPDVAEMDPKGPFALGLASCAVLVLGLVGWAAPAAITSAVVAIGTVAVAPYSHPVQHVDGGVIEQVYVHEGQAVEAGDLLVRLDGSDLRAALDPLEQQIVEAEARLVRLRAERDGLDFPVLAVEDMRDRARVAALGAPLRLYDARRDTFERQQAQLQERRRQTEAQLQGMIDQRTELLAETEILQAELRNQQTLRAQGLAVASQVNFLARARAQLSRDRVALNALERELRGQVAEIAMQSAALVAARRESAEQDFADTGLALIDLHARRATLLARLDAYDLRAPTSGVVHRLAQLGPHSVLRPAEEVMQIVTPPSDPVLTVRVRPDDVDHIGLGQLAYLRFPGLAGRELPDLTGLVTNLSAASFIDELTGTQYFRADIHPTEQTLAILGRDALIPGMSVQAFLATGERTPLAYLIDPLRDHFLRALREP